MANFAIVENGIVLNNIIAESQELAEKLTGMTCVEYNDSNPSFIGLGYNGKKFEQPKPDETISHDIQTL
jgi:hypothetical protein